MADASRHTCRRCCWRALLLLLLLLLLGFLEQPGCHARGFRVDAAWGLWNAVRAHKLLGTAGCVRAR
jgi:hypothetical protein